jgi:cobalt/nickel transport system permease protein
MGIMGAFVGYGVFKVLSRLKLPLALAAFLAGLLSDWATYAMTALELSLGLHGKESFVDLFKVIFIAFIPTQVPVGILEGFAAASLFAFILRRRPDIFVNLGLASANSPVIKDELSEEPAY